jgi:hypothetical protein
VDTGVSSTDVTNASGIYNVPNLKPGTYKVAVSSAGFRPAVRNEITLTVGSQRVVNIALSVGGVTQEVEVSATAQAVQLADSTISHVVNATTVRELPLNGRSWTDLAVLQPGVANPKMQPSFDGGRGQRGFGNQIAIGGSRPQENNYRMDGISVNDYANAGPGNVEGGALGVDAIQEFSVLTSTYSAEYGRASGGVINAITKSGTNRLHGDGYEFLRNDALDARNYFDVSKPAFHRNQFGGSLGGPIQKDRTFFFGDYEGLRESKGITRVNTVPSLAARAGNLSSGAVTVSPAISTFINTFYPTPNGAVTGDTAKASLASQRIAREDFFTTTVDHIFSDKDKLHGNFLYDNTNLTLPDEFGTKLSSYLVGRKTVTVEESHTFSNSFLNSVRVGFLRNPANVGATIQALNSAAKDPALGSIPGRNAPDIKVGGITEFTGGLGAPSNYNFHYNSIQAYDDAFLTRGTHSLKFGFSVERIRDNVTAVTDGNGVFSFGSLSDFLANRPTSFKGAFPATVTGRSIRQSIFGGYVQDDWRVRPSFTLNLGVRYEMTTIPTEVNGKLSVLRNISDANPHLGDPFFESNPTTRNFEPRVGFAWDPFHNGRTAVRGGFGIFDVLPLPYQFNLEYVFTAPFFKEGIVTGSPTLPGVFPSGAFPLIASNNSTLRQNYAPANPNRNYVMQYNLNVQNQVTPTLMMMVGYAGSRGIHQPFRSEDINMVLPTLTPAGYLWPASGGVKINPNVGVIRGLFYDGDAYYNSLQTQVSKQMGRGFQAQASYTFSRNIDTGTAGVAGDTFANSIPGLLWFNMALNRGLSDLNVSHNLVVSYTWTLPSPRASSAIAFLANGWQLGGIYSARTGIPFSAQIAGDPLGQGSDHAYDTPNLVTGPGCSSLVNPGNPNNYIKTQCFAFPNPKNLRGNAGRNILVGPGLSDLDFSLFKNNRITRISEAFNIQFRAEVFNILNHTNFSSPLDNSTLFDNKGHPVSSAGQIDSTSSSEREIQLALKVIW